MKKPYKLVIAALLALFLLVGGALPALALKRVEPRTVRVGFYHTDGYHMMDEDGNRSGYGYDVLQALKLYCGWDYEYIGYDKGWADIQQMILDGEVDMAVSAVKTPARTEIYDFSDRSIGQSGASLMVKAGESPYVAGQYEGYNGMRIGFIENASHIASTEAFAAEKGFTYIPVYYKTSDELENAIQTCEEVDAIVTSNMRILANTRRLDLFAMQDIHVMVQKGNHELLSEINYALEQISLYNPTLFSSLFNKYYSVDTGEAVFFTPEESRFIAECKADGTVLRTSLVPDIAPYAYYEDGKPAGILYDVVTEVLSRTGLDTELIMTTSSAEYNELIESGDVDVRLAARFDYNYAEKTGYKLTDPYYSTDVSRIMRKNHSGGIGSVGVVRNSHIDTHYLSTVVTDETVLYYDTVADCVRAVLGGHCDAAYLFTRTAQEAVYFDETNRLTSVIMPKYSFGFCIGVREDADPRLAAILQKAVSSISEEDVAETVIKYTDHPKQSVSLVGLLYSNPILFVALVALLIGLVFVAILLFFFSRQRRTEREKNEQLQAALNLAEQANSAKSVFMSRMSHEIRTPLNAIIGYNSISSSRLSEAKTEPEYRQAAMKAMDCLTKSDIASKHLLTVINDVLDMSAIESGKIKIAYEPFDFKDMITGLTVMFFSQAKAKGIDFEVRFLSATEEWFVGDSMRLNQILTNLLSNAVKFTLPGGSVCLTLRQTETDEQSAHICFEVTDTGIGMSKNFLSNIWTPFEQADASISRRFGGTGLGLSITKNLVDLMGGTIRVESETGVGTTFFVDVTLGRAEQPTHIPLIDFSGINVLVVDDDQSTCDYLKLLFNRCSVRCTGYTSGEDAISAVSRGIETDDPYTVCLIDWQMPRIDGLTVARRIRAIAGPDIPIIIISAYDYSEIAEAAKEVGVNTFVAKPLFQSAVYNLLAGISGKGVTVVRDRSDAYDFGGARILLAEDNRMNMEIAKALLAAWNLTVDEAQNGREAVAMACTAPAGTYKAILMDVHMPEMDGYRATQTIRSSDHADAATVPIIAMTADVFAEDVVEAMAAGMNDHIGKPIDKVLLLDTLRKYIEG